MIDVLTVCRLTKSEAEDDKVHFTLAGKMVPSLARGVLWRCQDWIAGPAGLVGFGTLFFLRVGREEALMLETFGDEYRRYMARTARVLPGVY